MSAEMEYAKVELKYDKGQILTVRTCWILNFKPKFSKTDDFLCYWSCDINEKIPNLECGYSKQFSGTPSLFKVFIVKLSGSLDELENNLEGKRLQSVSKRFREAGNTDTELKQIQTKKKRLEKKEVKKHKAKAQEVNLTYLIGDLEKQKPEKKETTNTESMPIENDLIDTPLSTFHLMSSTYEELVKSVVEDIEIDCLFVLDTEKEAFKADTERLPIGNDLTDQPQASFDLITSSHDELARGVVEGCDFNYVLNNELNEQTGDETLNYSDQAQHTEAEETEREVCEIVENGIQKDIREHSNASEITFYEFSDANNGSNNEGNIVIFNYDEVQKQNDDLTIQLNELTNTVNEQKKVISDLTTEANKRKTVANELKAEAETLKLENASLKQEIENGNKRNIMLQNYLVISNQIIPEDLFVEKNGGRLYKGGVFLNKNQCSVLDNSNSDREFLNNLTTAIFGREVLKTHSISGTPSNNTKGPAKNKLNPELIDLICAVMDARSFANNTVKLTKSEKNAIIGKKCSNVASYKPSTKSMSSASSVSENQNSPLPHEN